jgi:hypothetical protein
MLVSLKSFVGIVNGVAIAIGIKKSVAWRQFEPEVILMAARWYLRFSLSYRDVEELLAVTISHVTQHGDSLSV